MGYRMRWVAGVVAVVLCVAGASAPGAQSVYEIGPEDVIAITVWEHPELSRTLVVRADGTVTLPPLGSVQAAGKNTEALARDLEARIYGVLRIGAQVTVSVVAFNSRQIFLAGQVANPGRYSFEQIPGLLDVLGGSGGLDPTADLANVRILRKSAAGKPETIVADVARAMSSGEVGALPELRPGDVVFVPGSAAGPGGPGMGGGGVYVAGEVVRPGAYNLAPGMDLLQLLSVAGGANPAGDLSRVDVLGTDRDGSPFRVRVDLRREIEEGRRGPEIRAGDTVVVPSLNAGSGRLAWAVFRETIGVSRDVLNLVLIRDALK